MITQSQITPIGYFGKPHGVNGEINIIVNEPVELESLSCIVLDIDGINVPFFFNSIRRRGAESFLVTVDGISSEQQASMLVNKKVYALVGELDADYDDADPDGFYAEDLIGFKVETVDNVMSGEIVGVDDSTDNVLFEVQTDEGRDVLVPVADEFIEELDVEKRTVVMNLPAGLLSL